MLRLTRRKPKATVAPEPASEPVRGSPVKADDRASDGSLAAYGGIALVSASIGAVAVGALAIGALALGRQIRRRRLARLATEAIDRSRMADEV